ncbi:hypothetical protein ABB37_09683 [Leptomonas pyrrhocoris]|uniref:Uncharacterized protein n=1 Tax=Leptomonas pyrrhocoris TaxID=157538 RepID=A0A0N0VCV8_LEPPY|nr:hypothetical protein ABB37_09683 [Leptomonas pyrrhocoris]KPA73802.1 hypothetical protein ABB37_09683 [Leptomonas pyrrhocoris]|eukprot:XP_015652241.1 hypothetical protein ABB37_09683 [Leptomonas pyrrhocoris]
MSAEVDREAFMRLMGLTAADVADPDGVPQRTPSRTDASSSSSTEATAAAAMAHRHGPASKVSSSLTSSAEGLSQSASLRGEADLLFNSYSNGKSSLRVADGDTRLNSTFTPSTERRAAPLKQSARTVSFDTPPHRAPTAAPASMPPRPASTAETLKEEGNRAFEAGLFLQAVQRYSAAIEALGQSGAVDGGGDSSSSGSATCSAQVELLAALHSNRSAAYLQAVRQWGSAEEAYGRALCDADRAVALRPSWFKGYARQGDAYFKLRRYGPAAEAYEMALQLDPRNATLANALAETRLRAKQAAREELEMRRSMRATGSSRVSSMGSTERDLDGTKLSDSAGRTQETGARRLSGQTQQLWQDLKHEVEVTTHAPTGDAYRLQQLERFRSHGGAARPEQESGPLPGPASTRDGHPPPRPTVTRTPSPNEKTTSSTSRRREDRAAISAAASVDSASSSAPVPPPRRSANNSPTAGGIPAAVANFGGPVTSARDVPYEFSSAAAAAYQEKLLDNFRQRKAQRS